jgi:nucleoside-diphosphate-sugar epimerase
MKTMKALVTGATGFIGSTLIENLIKKDFEVYAYMRNSSNPSNLKGLTFHRVEGDLSDYPTLCAAVKNVDYVFHLAGVISGPNREYYFEHNAKGTLRVARAVAEENDTIKKFVFVSSLAAAGPATTFKPRVETDQEQPVSSYGESKLLAEQELLKFKEIFPISIIRPPLVYGPKDKGVFTLIKTVSRNIIPLVQGNTEDGNKFYSVVHGDDLVDGIIQAALNRESASGEVFYIAGDEIYSYAELLRTMAKIMNLKPVEFRVPLLALSTAAHALTWMSKISGKTFSLNVDKLNEIRPDYWICSNEKAKRVLGFHPKYDLNQGMEQTIRWYKKEGWLK